MELNIEEFDKELKIDNASMFALEGELLSHPKKIAKYYRWYAQAIKEVDRLTLAVETNVAEITSELVKQEEKDRGKSIPAYAMSSIQKRVPADKRYQKVKKRLSEAKEDSNILKGFVKAFESRGYRLKELIQLSEWIMLPEPRIYKKGGRDIRFGEKDLETKMEEASKKID